MMFCGNAECIFVLPSFLNGGDAAVGWLIAF